MKAHVVYRDGQLTATLSTGHEMTSNDPYVLAERLYAAGVTKEEVTMPDWREGESSPPGGLKIALYWRLAQLRTCGR
ncbi:hypothetical protein ACUXAV_004549 [Cupriavidus metallidurans]|uniref:hypothetical protein n=1 Tax=Cupriavidus metallidurans TaxID=119219 RepID=UPI0004932134|nr:hypothetical protein [Cupriavidus metallidurans]MDE4919564.1 hypothetical protein [Cupriavidus metallidurans]